MGAIAFQRTGLLFLLVGIGLGMKMGASQDFSMMPVHAHINLVGGVLMFIAGLFYASRPDIPRRAVSVHYWLHLVGALLLVAGIYGAMSHAPWYGPVVGAGSVGVMLAMLVFAWNVFRRPPGMA
jgi:hypothetical protein